MDINNLPLWRFDRVPDPRRCCECFRDDDQSPRDYPSCLVGAWMCLPFSGFLVQFSGFLCAVLCSCNCWWCMNKEKKKYTHAAKASKHVSWSTLTMLYLVFLCMANWLINGHCDSIIRPKHEHSSNNNYTWKYTLSKSTWRRLWRWWHDFIRIEMVNTQKSSNGAGWMREKETKKENNKLVTGFGICLLIDGWLVEEAMQWLKNIGIYIYYLCL